MLAAGSSTLSWTGLGVLGMAAGSFVVGAGASDMNQGWEEFFLGLSGDSTTQTRNGMSDLFYDGNDTIYHLSTGVAAFAGSLLTPYVNAQLAGKTGVTAAGSTAGNGKTAGTTVTQSATQGARATGTTTAGKATGVKPTVAEAAGGTVDDALEQFYDDIFESSYREQFDPIKEQAIVGMESGEGGTSLSFKTQKLLDSHFIKHGAEFGNITKEQYIQGANNLINSSGENILTKIRTNGDTIFYNVDTNEFAVKSAEGFIRTYFKPIDGLDYFIKQ